MRCAYAPSLSPHCNHHHMRPPPFFNNFERWSCIIVSTLLPYSQPINNFHHHNHHHCLLQVHRTVQLPRARWKRPQRWTRPVCHSFEQGCHKFSSILRNISMVGTISRWRWEYSLLNIFSIQDDPEWFWVVRADAQEGFVPAGSFTIWNQFPFPFLSNFSSPRKKMK